MGTDNCTMAQQQNSIDAQRAWDEKHRIAPEEARHMVDFFESQPDVYRRRVPAPFAAQLMSQTVHPDAPTQPDRFEHDAELMAQQNGIPLWKARASFGRGPHGHYHGRPSSGHY